MGNRQSTPSASCDLICGRGQPITTIASLCARRLLPAGGEREGTREEEGGKRNKLRGRTGWMDGESEYAAREKERKKCSMRWQRVKERGQGWGIRERVMPVIYIDNDDFAHAGGTLTSTIFLQGLIETKQYPDIDMLVQNIWRIRNVKLAQEYLSHLFEILLCYSRTEQPLFINVCMFCADAKLGPETCMNKQFK